MLFKDFPVESCGPQVVKKRGKPKYLRPGRKAELDQRHGGDGGKKNGIKPEEPFDEIRQIGSRARGIEK